MPIVSVQGRELKGPEFVQELSQYGIVRFDSPYDDATIQRWNQRIDPLFLKQQHLPRSYVRTDEMRELGIIDEVFNPWLRQMILALFPDPILFHFNIFEIAGNQDRPHIFSGMLRGWHRDSDVEFEAQKVGAPEYLSLFLYLTPVGDDDAPFEIIPQIPNGLQPQLPSYRVMGKAGSLFLWNRDFYHRAGINRGPRRRRVLKLSLQAADQAHRLIHQADFQAAKEFYRSRDPFLSQLFGENFQGPRKSFLDQRQSDYRFRTQGWESNSSLEVGPFEALVYRFRRRFKLDKLAGGDY